MKEGELGAKAQSLKYVRQILRKVILSQRLWLATGRNKWSWKTVRKTINFQSILSFLQCYSFIISVHNM